MQKGPGYRKRLVEACRLIYLRHSVTLFKHTHKETNKPAAVPKEICPT